MKQGTAAAQTTPPKSDGGKCGSTVIFGDGADLWDEAIKCWSGAMSKRDVANMANPGSFEKARWLVSMGAVRIPIISFHGEVTAKVGSEKGGDREYVVRAKPLQVPLATCTCADFKTRKGLCKHGAAVVLHVLEGGKLTGCKEAVPETPSPPAAASSRRRERAAHVPAMPMKAVPFALNRGVKRPATGPAAEDEARFPNASVQRPLDPFDLLQSKEAPGARQEVAAACAPGRRSGARAALASRMQIALVKAGKAVELEKEIQRGVSPEDAPRLVHLALQIRDGNESAPAQVLAALLNRPECVAAVGAPDEHGSTPLHVAIGRERLDLCQLLLGAKADAGLRDAAGRTALEFALARPVDAAVEDPIVKLLKSGSA